MRNGKILLTLFHFLGGSLHAGDIAPGSLVFLVPGSFSGDGRGHYWYMRGGEFHDVFEYELKKKDSILFSFPWAGSTGFLTVQMISAARDLAAFVLRAAFTAKERIPVYLVAHSNGGNVSKLVSQLIDLSIGREERISRFEEMLGHSSFLSLTTVEGTERLLKAFQAAVQDIENVVDDMEELLHLQVRGKTNRLIKAIVTICTPHVPFIRHSTATVEQITNIYSTGDKIQDGVGYVTFREWLEGEMDNDLFDGASDIRLQFLAPGEVVNPGHNEVHIGALARALPKIDLRMNSRLLVSPDGSTLPIRHAKYKGNGWAQYPHPEIPHERFPINLSCQIL